MEGTEKNEAVRQEVPHLRTIQNKVVFDLEKQILDNQTRIESWFRAQWAELRPLVTCSVDLRHAGYKLAPVDTNLFPAGFNNLNSEFLPLCIQAAQQYFSQYHPKCDRILLVAESHTRNVHYLNSLKTLQSILSQAGYEVKIGSLRDIEAPDTFKLSDETMTQWPILKNNRRLYLQDFEPDLILLNNDLSEGTPDLFIDIEQPILPSPDMGWDLRSKAIHFKHYQNIAERFCQTFDVDPWLITPLFSDCEDIDFSSKNADACLIEKTDELLEKIQARYDHYKITDPPFVAIKADAGTYGMAVMMVKDSNEIKQWNRKQRQSMQTRKGGQSVKRMLLQEGIYTQETFGADFASAEPVIYMMGSHVIGGFYRVHGNKNKYDNLNAPGMHFEPLAFETCCNTPDARLNPHDARNQFYVYSVIARLAHIAATQEAPKR